MNTYEITRPDGTTQSVNASGYSWDKAIGGIAFYDGNSNRVASYDRGEWTALHMRLPLVRADAPEPTPIKAQEFYELYGH